MPASKIIFTLESLSDILFGFKHDIRATNIHCDQENGTVHLWVEGTDVPEAPRTYLEYSAVYGHPIDRKRKKAYAKLPSVREVRLTKISANRD
jgi:hypothetical protein